MLAIALLPIAMSAKTLVAYYSFTNNVERIVTELSSQIEADVIEIEPAEKGLDYAANNYALGTQLLNAIRNNPDDASSYPAIDPVDVELGSTVGLLAQAAISAHSRCMTSQGAK